MTDIYDTLCAEKDELTHVLESGDSAVQDVINKTTRMETARNNLQKQVNKTKQRITNEEKLFDGINEAGEKVAADANKQNKLRNLKVIAKWQKKTKTPKIIKLKPFAMK